LNYPCDNNEARLYRALLLFNLPTLDHRQGRYEIAQDRCVQAQTIFSDILGSDDPNTLNCMNLLAILYTEQRFLKEAEVLAHRIAEARTKTVGPERPDTLHAIVVTLANIYRGQARFSKAEYLVLELLQMRTRVQGIEHLSILAAMPNVALVYLYNSRYDQAEKLLLELLDTRTRIRGEDNPEILSICKTRTCATSSTFYDLNS
jgi:tetratricopeptide (TPR) repeat protein